LWFGVVRVGTGFHPYGSSLDGMKKKNWIKSKNWRNTQKQKKLEEFEAVQVVLRFFPTYTCSSKKKKKQLKVETLPRELVWEVVACLPVRDVLMGVALASRDFHQLLYGSSPPPWTSNEFWRLYALRWRLVGDGNGEGDDALEPPCWRSFCRAGTPPAFIVFKIK
jgi:hypothetical protein